MNPTRWTPDRGDEPRRTNRVLRWYRLRLTGLFRQVAQQNPERAAALIEWFADHPEREFLQWEPWREYQGAGYGMGRWTVDLGAINRAIPRAKAELAAADRQQQRLATPPPIPAGPIDVEAALEALSAPAAASPAEPGAFDLLVADTPPPHWSEAYIRLFLAHHRIERRIERTTPRPCHCCGEQFVGRQVSAITCDRCRAAGTKRCTACKEVFPSVGRGPRKCERCRAQPVAGREALS